MGSQIAITLLDKFFEKAANDPGIDPGHIALFMALFKTFSTKDFQSPITVFSNDIMPIAKISSSATYFAKLSYLSKHGYIDYEPSRYGKKGSKFSLPIEMNSCSYKEYHSSSVR